MRGERKSPSELERLDDNRMLILPEMAATWFHG